MEKYINYNFLNFKINDAEHQKEMRESYIMENIKKQLLCNVKQQLNENFTDKQKIIQSIEGTSHVNEDAHKHKKSSDKPSKCEQLEFTDKTKTDITIYNLHEMCEKIPFNDNIDPLKPHTINHNGCVFNDGTNFTIPSNSYQYIIGRIDTLAALNKETNISNCSRIKFLNLEGNKLIWSAFVNDLFVYCGIAHGAHLRKQPDHKPFQFPIRLILDNRCKDIQLCRDDNACKKHNEEDENIYISYEELKKFVQFCIIPKNISNTPYDPVTFREIIILTKIFGLHAYEWKGDLSKVGDLNISYYFFSFDNISQETLNKEEANGKHFKKVAVKFEKGVSVQFAGDYYMHQYKKYKTKYLQLKKKMNL